MSVLGLRNIPFLTSGVNRADVTLFLTGRFLPHAAWTLLSHNGPVDATVLSMFVESEFCVGLEV